MITGIDHIVLLCEQISEGLSAYEGLLGRAADWRARDPDGADTAFFQLDNMALELIAPRGDGPLAERLQTLLNLHGPGLQSLVFASDNIEEDRRVFAKRALEPSPIQSGASTDLKSQQTRHWARFRIDDAKALGVRMFVLQRSEGDPLVAKAGPASALSSLDHLVINTFNPEASVALYGSRLGLRLSLDLLMPERDARLLSFKAGRSTIELSHRVSKADQSSPDKMWGITWRTADIEGAHSRMTTQGLNVSEIRQGMRKGTKVFTVRVGALTVPSLILAESPPL